jgi:ECF sigma factor
MLESMNDVTRILSAIEQGEPHAAEQLLPLVYDELRKLAAQKLVQEAPGQTLQATCRSRKPRRPTGSTPKGLVSDAMRSEGERVHAANSVYYRWK